MNQSNLMVAHRQWASRPPDERFRTLDGLIAAVAARRSTSSTLSVGATRLSVIPTQHGDLRLSGMGTETVGFSNWSFTQLAGSVKAPADFVASLPAPLAADVMNHRLHRASQLQASTPLQLLLGQHGHEGVLRAVTSTEHQRIWDLDVVQLVRRLTRDTAFQNPLAYRDGRFGGEIEPGGLYASDRDVFLTLWDESRPIEV